MAITASNVLIKYSTKSGSAGNSLTGTAAGSLGKYISTTEITDASSSNLFAAMAGSETITSTPRYRCIFVHNNHGTDTFTAPVVWISAEVAKGASVALAVDDTAASAVGSASAQAREITDDQTAPSVITFSSPTTKVAGLSLGDIGPGQCKAFWVRRTPPNHNMWLANDGATFTIEGT